MCGCGSGAILEALPTPLGSTAALFIPPADATQCAPLRGGYRPPETSWLPNANRDSPKEGPLLSLAQPPKSQDEQTSSALPSTRALPDAAQPAFSIKRRARTF